MDEVCLHYASALFDTLSGKQRDEALEALETVKASLVENPKFFELLRSYNLSALQRREVIRSTFGKLLSPIPHLLPFLYVVSDYHRMKVFPEIVEGYRSLLNASNGVKEGIAYSALRLSSKELSAIENALAKRLGSKVHLHNIVDSRLIGGVKVAVDGKIYDGTIAAKLQGLSRSLKGGTLS